MNSLIFNYQPGRNLVLYVTSSTIDKYYEKYNSSFSSFETRKNDSYIMEIDLEIINCTVGEIFRKSLLMFQTLIFNKIINYKK